MESSVILSEVAHRVASDDLAPANGGIPQFTGEGLLITPVTPTQIIEQDIAAPASAMLNLTYGLFRRKRATDYIDKSQWAYIDSGATASQTATLVTSGMMAAIAAAKAGKTELDVCDGVFLLNLLALTDFNDAAIVGGMGTTFQLASGQTLLMELRTSVHFLLEKLKFKGTATADGVYRAHDLLDIRTNSGFGTVRSCEFTDFARWGAVTRLLNGGTYSEGIKYLSNLFRDAPNYGNVDTAGLAFGADGEYSTASFNEFYRIPSAARFTDGANGKFTHNVVMQLNGGSGALQTDRAGVYIEYSAGGNGGKMDISHNQFNHNATGLIPLIIRQNTTQPQNSSKITHNDFLVNGNGTVGYQVVAYSCYALEMSGNKYRPSTAGVHPNVRLNSCDAARISNEGYRDGTYGLELATSVGVQYSICSHDNHTVGKVLLDTASTLVNQNGRTRTFRISSSGAAATAPWDDPNWTVVHTATGTYTITHNMNSLDYSVHTEQDNATSPSGLNFSKVRGLNTTVIYITNNSAVLTDANITVTFVLGNLNPIAL